MYIICFGIITPMNISTPELLSNFSAYLTGQQLSSVTIKNYLSDIRYFIDWYVTNFDNSSSLTIDQQITPQTLNLFHHHLTGDLPLKTANRRLSSVRKFCQFLHDQNYTVTNSANNLPNIPPPSYHLLHQLPDPILQAIDLESTNQHFIATILPPAPILTPPLSPSPSSSPPQSHNSQLITYSLLPIIIPIIVFIISLTILTLLTPPLQLLT